MLKNTAQDLSLSKETQQLKEKILSNNLPKDLQEKTLMMISRLERIINSADYSVEYDKLVHYLNWILPLPWQKKTIDSLDLKRAKEIMDKNHYGMEQVKERMLEFLSVLKLTQNKQTVSRAPILCLVGLVGTGKTTFSHSLAEVMGRKFGRIPFGGMGSALDLRGQSRLHPDNEPGQIIKTLRRAQSKNPVILLDEIDRISDKALSEIMGVLIELLDPEQNQRFTDHYLDYPFDLSDVLFIATCNNTTKISPAVLDRMEVLQMPSYSDEEKIIISKDYLLPKIKEQFGLEKDSLIIDEDLWPKIVRPLGFDSGIRSLERTIKSISRKIAKLIVEGKGRSFHLTQDNINKFLTIW